MSFQQQPKYTSDEYLALERQAQQRTEYLNGHIFEMAGGSRAHNLIVVNLVSELRNQLRGRPCEAYANDMRVRGYGNRTLHVSGRDRALRKTTL